MPADVQLRLLPAPQPLVERLGAEFFRGAPRAPGVYRMFDAAGKLIYVGKARDLRARLSSYRRTHGQSRKTVRLIHTVRRIEWELCTDEAHARRLENEWIRTARPRFNRAGTWPRSARYVGLELLGTGFRLRVIADPAASGETFGAFRGGAAAAVAALARLLWFAWHHRSESSSLPQPLITTETLREFDAEHPDAAAWLASLCDFFTGESDAILGRLIAAVPEPATPFDRAFLARQFETLVDFHRRGPIRNRRLRSLLPGNHASALTPEEQSDWFAWLGPETTPPAWRLRATEAPTPPDSHEPPCLPPAH